MALEKLPDGRYTVRVVRGVATEIAPACETAIVIPLAHLPAVIADSAVVGGELLEKIAAVVLKRCG